MRTVESTSRIVGLLLGLVTLSVFAAASPAPVQGVVAIPTQKYVAGIGQSVDSAMLAKLSGGTQITERMTLNGTVTDNSADQVMTGSNAIDSGAFRDAAGLPTVIQNTGNNVLIQNATIVNVQFQP